MEVEKVQENRDRLQRYGFLARLCESVLAGEIEQQFAFQKAVLFYAEKPLDDSSKREELEFFRTAIDYDPPKNILKGMLRPALKNDSSLSR